MDEASAAPESPVDPVTTDDEVPPDGPEFAGDRLQVRLAELIDESSGLSRRSGDWSAGVAIELAEQLLASEQADLRVGEGGSVQALNLALYRMSYEASLACEHARQLGARPSHSVSTSGDCLDPAETLKQRLRTALAARGDDSDGGAVVTIGRLARVLCLGLIGAYEARDRYDYAAMQASLEVCDDYLPAGCTLKSFRVLECMRVIAQAGLSREPGGSPPNRRDLEALAGLISEDRDQGGGPYADHSLLLLVSALGQVQRRDLVDDEVSDMQRRDLVDDEVSDGAGTKKSLVDWILEVLQGMEERGVAKAQDWPIANQPNLMAHHLHYYRHFAHHVQAIALANQLKEPAATQAEDAPFLSVSDVKREYSKASVSLERALQVVPPSNQARWRYYDLNAENLEHEENLRIELLEQRLSTRQTVRDLAEANVQRLSEVAKEELRSRMADVSMRIVEVIGIFLAVVAILGATVASATVDGLSLGERILVLAIGGSMPVVYFVLLRWIVAGKLSKRRARG